MGNKLRVIQDRLVDCINLFTIRSVLYTGFSLIISLAILTALLTEWTDIQAMAALNRLIKVDNEISDLCLKSNTLMSNARRNEKDFVLSYKDFGLNEAKSRYISRALNDLADLKQNMKKIRLLTDSPEIARRTEAVDQAVGQYQEKLLSMVEKYGALGFLDTGLEGTMRRQAHEIEGLLQQQKNDPLLADLLLMRHWEKDFMRRNRDIDVTNFRKEADHFAKDLAASEMPPERKEKLGKLADTYETILEEYIKTTEEIRTDKSSFLKSIQIIEPTLEKLYRDAVFEVDNSLMKIEENDRLFTLIKAGASLFALLVSVVVAISVSLIISRAVAENKSFAEQIAAGDLSQRLTQKGENEFASLTVSLNSMADALQQSDVLQKKWTDDLIRSEQRFRAIFENATDGILLSDPKTGKFYDGNRMICQMLGYTSEEIKNLGIMDIYSKKDRHHAAEQFEKQARQEIKTARDLLVKRKDLTVFYADVNTSQITLAEKTYVMGIFRDITERKQSESQIRFLAYYDGLTGLPNRTFFKELFKKALVYAERYKLMVAILYLDLDDFKRINDTFGHETGDSLLQAVAERLSGTVRQSDNVARATEEAAVVSRLGGDEFVILLSHINTIHEAGKVAHRILSEISRPFELNGQEVFITASMGISLYPSGGENVDDQLKNADSAMYHAKSAGKNHYQFYSEAMNAAALEQLTLENNLHKALDQKELLVYYQPKMDLATMKIIGMEALIRWQHPEMGLVSPSQFIPLAETSGLIMPIGKFVLHAACLQNKLWQDAGHEAISVAVNLSGRQFDQKNLIAQIYKILDDTGLSPQYLELEVTESTVMRDPEKAILILQELKAAGIQIALDDFGTGYSSLSYLKRLPLDAVKIDISFVRNVTTNPSDAVIVRTIIAMAHSLNLKTIAEGVENEQQLAFLKEHGCDVMQGFLLSPALPPDEFLRLLASK